MVGTNRCGNDGNHHVYAVGGKPASARTDLTTWARASDSCCPSANSHRRMIFCGRRVRHHVLLSALVLLSHIVAADSEITTTTRPPAVTTVQRTTTFPNTKTTTNTQQGPVTFTAITGQTSTSSAGINNVTTISVTTESSTTTTGQTSTSVADTNTATTTSLTTESSTATTGQTSTSVADVSTSTTLTTESSTATTLNTGQTNTLLANVNTTTTSVTTESSTATTETTQPTNSTLAVDMNTTTMTSLATGNSTATTETTQSTNTTLTADMNITTTTPLSTDNSTAITETSQPTNTTVAADMNTTTTTSLTTDNSTSTAADMNTTTTTPLTTDNSTSTTGITEPTNTSSAGMNTTTTTSLTSTGSSNATAPSPVKCDFSKHCVDYTMYYWMIIRVEVTGNLSNTNESDITNLLRNQFRNNLDNCSSSLFTATLLAGQLSNDSYINNTASPLFRMTSEKASVTAGNENTSSVFEDLEVMCNEKNFTRETTCNVVLLLTEPSSSCCIKQSITNAPNSSIKFSVVGDHVEQVAKGICHSKNTGSLGFEKCNGSLSSEDFCNATVTLNVSCSGNSETVFASLDIQDQMNCTSSTSKPQSYCYCSPYCSSNAAYYSFNVIIKNSSFNMAEVSYLIPDILKNATMLCQNESSSSCQNLENITQIYENLTIQCGPLSVFQNCTVIMKLSQSVAACSLSSALLSALQNQSDIQTPGIVSRVAICSWGNTISVLQSNFVIVELTGGSSNFCMIEDINNKIQNCKEGTDVAVLLQETCIPATPTIMPSSTVSINMTLLSNTTISQNITTTSPYSMNTTVSTNSSTSAAAEAEGLLNLSENASALNSSQVEKLVSQLEALLSGPNVSFTLGNTSINIVSNLLSASPNVLATTSKRVIRIVDTVGLKLVVSSEGTILSRSLALAVKMVDGVNFQETTFTITDPSKLQIGSLAKRSVETKVASPQGSITLPAHLTQNLTAQQQQLASRVQFNFYQKDTLFQDKALKKRTLISGVLASSVTNLSISNLENEVVITLKNTQAPLVNESVSCVFWDFNLNGGSGGWSSEGCTVLNTTRSETVCGCTHLTSFGVLLDISGQQSTNRLQETILSYITYIGCGISAIFLSITLLTYLSFEKLRKDIPSKILIQLCLALLLLNLVFLLDAWLALYRVNGLCISTAFFLHYFLLASFTWMALEAVHMYLAIVKVFNTYVSRFMLKLGLAGWGIPLIVVIIVIAIPTDNYGLVSYGKFEDGTTDEFCWIKKTIAFYVSVVAYFCVVFLLNLSMFIVVMVQLCRIKRQNHQNLQHRSAVQDLRSVAGLTVLLGLTWGFAFFAWDPVNLPFMYLFAIFNSFQGFFIFVFHCAAKENVRRQWRTYLCCGKLRLAENSDWSHTATQRTKKSSINKLASSFRSNNSSSSKTFLVNNGSGSDRSLGISSPLDDTAVTAQEEPTSDVVLNDLNHRYRSLRYQ